MLRLSFILLILFPFFAKAQFTISGKIINLYDKKPVAKASIFLSNTTVGGSSNDDGAFLLSDVKPGQYDMVISSVGYEKLHKTLQVNQNLALSFVELTPKTVELNAVVVKPDPNWVQNYQMFKEEFFGRSPEAAQCKILNPEILDLHYDKATNELSASTVDYLEIENKALGYNLKYNLIEFKRNYRSGVLFYFGNTLYTPIKAKPSQQKKWYKARLRAYLGSSQHYFRSLLGNRLKEEGFNTMRLMRKPNSERQPDSLIQAKLKHYRQSNLVNGRFNIQATDSLSYWSKQKQLPLSVDYLVSKPLRVDSLVKRTDVAGIFALSFNDILYVVYTRKADDGSLFNKPINAPDHPTSLINFNEQYAFFDANGIIINPSSIMCEGAWGVDRMAKMLPVDYDPKEVNTKP
ncbi:carboxypeptidase-like regulatory domain-containing protein [uncultured Mucilaginibacter sp.]|uniref:carboxypeptidase-like regulatory domain-containing protein n=1 Tax=uncultured Mucilaginibacter sp. TaxID=797541 RepID=UPI0025CC4F12|nr:carboxypeptidase-like regulatory domain-containing protein [uncultured Mucilaginibacter sp.]